MNSPADLTVFRWQPASWLKVTGADAAQFLQGQFTNDLKQAGSENGVYGLWLNVKGKVVADSFVLPAREGEAIWIASYFSPTSIIRERLESYVIADDVVIEDETDRVAALTVFGAVDPRMAEIGRHFAGRRDRSPHREMVFPRERAAEVEACLAGAQMLSAAEIEARRIAAAIPAIPRDIGANDLPNEAGLEHEAISYTKGCYLGQEVMARLKSMGQVRRRLLRVSGPAPLPAALPAPLFAGARQVGELRSAVASGGGELDGLAMITLLHAGPGARLALAPEGEPALVVHPIP